MILIVRIKSPTPTSEAGEEFGIVINKTASFQASPFGGGWRGLLFSSCSQGGQIDRRSGRSSSLTRNYC